MKRYALYTLIIGILLLLLFACSGINSKPKITPGNDLPSREIVFSPDVSLPSTDEDTIGFIDSDGSNFATRKIATPITTINGLPFKHYSSFISPQMSWSSNGYYLGVTMGVTERMTGFPILVSSNGEFVYCPQNRIPYTSNRFWANDDGLVMISTAISEKFNQNAVILYDMLRCKKIKDIFSSEDYIVNATRSTHNLLAVSVKSYTGDIGRTEIYSDGGSLIFTLPLTSDLSWSKSGEWLAYTLYEKNPILHIINQNGKQDQKVTEITRSPSWSPDGQWIVFERDHQIIKINVLTKEQIILAKGTYPNWRWNVLNTNE